MFSRDSNQDLSNSTTRAQSEQSSSRSSFGGGLGRPNSNSRPQAYGGGGWGRPQNAQPAASGGWGRTGFQRSPAAVGGGWGRRRASEEASMQQPQQPQQSQQSQQPQQPQQSESEQEQSCEVSAPPERYDYEFVLYAFNQKYELPKDLSQDELPVLDSIVIDYIASNPLRYGQPIKAAVDRALLKIHEELQSKLRKTIPEKDSHPPALTMGQEFTLELTKTLSSYGHSSAKDVEQFVAEYMRKPLSDLVYSDRIDPDTMRPMCLRSSQAYTDQHMIHAIYTYFLSLDLRSILRDRFGFVDHKIPTRLVHQLPPNVRTLIKSAKGDHGRVVNGFLMVYPHEMQYDVLRKKLLESLITNTQQSNSFHIVSLTTKDRPTTGDICLIIPDRIYTQTKSEKESMHAKTLTKKPGMSQYRTQGPKGCILLGMDQVLDWNMHGIQCSFNGTNMQLHMEQFCTILRSHWGAVPLFIEDEPRMTVSREMPEHVQLSIHDDTSSAGGGWGAAAPK